MNQNLYLLQSTTEYNYICSVAAGSSFWAVSNAELVFVYVFSVVLICFLEGYLLCLVSVIQLLPFWHVPLLTYHLVGLNAGYPGGGGTSAPCSTGIAWAGRGISKTIAWYAPCVLYLWWWLFQDSQSWLPWWKWDTRSVFHWHCMGQCIA